MKPFNHTVLTAAFALLGLVGAGALSPVTEARAERIKDLASVQGVRMNQLVGYGLVVGLDGSGDQTTQTPFTVQSITSMLGQLGVNLPPGTSLQLKNVAAVMITAQLPPFSQPGQTIDVTVSSMGNAKSLRGGTLVLSPLKGADGQIYAMAQGNVLVGGVGASTAGGSSVQINHLSVGRISAGATIERAVATQLGQDGYIYLGLNTTDFSTTRRVVDGINKKFGDGIASAIDARMIQVAAPVERDRRVEFVALLEELDVTPAESAAKVIINARTGSVIMNNRVTIDTCAISHGNLSVVITSEPIISQPGAFSSGQTVQANREQIEIRQDKGGLTMVRGANLSDVVKALNSIGATPQDLLAILQSMKAAGALRADLEII
ncbi:MAG: flagellar basal body P-ring protein FlgI [Betaproteobacteria bacterium]